MERPAERSFGVTLIAILLAVNGILTIVGALTAFGTAGSGIVGLVIGVIFGLALLYLAYGMWTLQSWAWLATLLLEILNAVFGLLAVILVPGAIGAWISLVLALIIIFYLTRPAIHAEFGARRARP